MVMSQIRVTTELCRPSADILCGRPPEFSPFELKISAPLASARGNVLTNFGSFTPFRFPAKSQYRMDRRTNRRTDGRARRVVRPVRRTCAQ